MRSRTAMATAALLALATAPLAATRLHAEQFERLTYNYTTNGPKVVLQNWTCWFGTSGGCKYAPCHMKTAREPKLGRLKPVVTPGTIPANGGACAGNPVPVLNITYTPKPGLHGSDEIVLESHSENGWAHEIDIHVDVP